MLTEIEDCDDVFVAQLASRGGLVAKPRQKLGLAAGREGLDGHHAADGRIEGAKDLTEAATAQFGLHFISADAVYHQAFARTFSRWPRSPRTVAGNLSMIQQERSGTPGSRVSRESGGDDPFEFAMRFRCQTTHRNSNERAFLKIQIERRRTQKIRD